VSNYLENTLKQWWKNLDPIGIN